MSDRKWTPAQQDAIDARQGTLLVSAAAGSGKTAVLVQRVIERLTDPVHPSDADRLLVVTFTKAAAAEMKERISQRLSELLARDPSNVNLQRQQLLLAKASISTIHSFCSELVRENFFKLDISPDFRIAEDSEMSVLRNEAVTRVLEANYEKVDPEFGELVEAFSSDRDDSRIVDMIDQLYDFIRSHPFPKRWLEQNLALYQPEIPAGETVWGERILEFANETVNYCLSLTMNSLSVMEEDEKISAAYGPAFQSDLAELLNLQQVLNRRAWDEAGRLAGAMKFASLKPLRGYGDDPLKNRLSACRTEVKDTVKKLALLFESNEEECAGDIRRLSLLVECLFRVTMEFSDLLDALKAERRMADFGDLEHWALRLLVRGTENGYERTGDAVELSARFDEIMVDEYQDTNAAQDMLFRAISQDEGNLFMVGDVKQSIYGFRQAMPQIFLKRRADFPEYNRDLDQYPACIILDRNFRSRRQVTDAVNFVFSQIMSPEAGDVDYSGKELLDAGAVYPQQPGCETQLEILDLSGEDGEKDMALAEARRIAELIHEIIGSGFQITENGVTRDAVFRDFCVLLRSANQYATQYAKEMQLCGVPSWADTAQGFFSSAEVAVVLSLLRVIDNPIQDIPLLSVLMSPIYGFTPDELATAREGRRDVPLYLALKARGEDGDAHAAAFLEEMDRCRALAATMPSDRLISTLYEKTGYLNMVQAMTNGSLRLANLQLLLEHAKKYESSGYNGLSGFIRFIDRLQAQDSDLPGASSLSESADVVRIMSIHKSKGLEFPVCIIAGCARGFNRERGDAMLHPDLGLGVKLRNPETMARYNTLPREAVALELERESRSEELRILYVAMTRAREKLVLMTSVKRLDRRLGALASQLTGEKKIQPYVVRGGDSFSDWLLSCALRHPDGEILRERALAPEDIVVRDGGLPWKIRLTYPPLPPEESAADEISLKIPPDPEQQEKLERQIDFVYPYWELKGVPSKVAASDLAEEESGGGFDVLTRPAFLSRSGLSPAERGTALHTYMQFADYGAAQRDPKAELERLVENGFLTAEQGGAVDLNRVLAFFESDIAKRMLGADQCQRELRFTVELPAGRVHPELSDDLKSQPVVLQGAVDCVFVENGHAVVVDYKTDRAGSPEELWRRYHIQLELYRDAVEQFLELPVGEVLLYSFYWNQVVKF